MQTQNLAPRSDPTLITADAGNPAEIRRLTRDISRTVNEDASIALREFLANVREHCSCKRVEIVRLPSVLIAYDHGGGIRNTRTSKPCGEGGYGLFIMRALGAEIRHWEEGTMFVMILAPDAAPF